MWYYPIRYYWIETSPTIIIKVCILFIIKWILISFKFSDSAILH
jgi:hypothetical protein